MDNGTPDATQKFRKKNSSLVPRYCIIIGIVIWSFYCQNTVIYGFSHNLTVMGHNFILSRLYILINGTTGIL
jgi:hypothetical protein